MTKFFENETLKNAEVKRTLMRDLVNNADTLPPSGLPAYQKQRHLGQKRPSVSVGLWPRTG